ncbi:NUDIX hydrolase [Streptomyces sp. NPDC088354]|uniref:NUDIX hydrolase n=1 Tax=unclassified Streptomyces TaxID=2593676 RepID=UPI0029B58ECF|nr:NUDIX domain-containing protein [Streptomyces sp. MI02-7b]MDX3077086.1 NUDIX domain-containing protein [Streptomyces sp. MI02-7b]
MPIPEFIRELRALVGHRQLLLPGVTAVVLDDDNRVLLNRRADNGRWSLIGGISEPGEQPAETAVREVLEETGVRAVAERVVLVQTIKPVLYPNGDRCQYVDITLRCRAVGGEAHVADDESLEVAWFGMDELPELGGHGRLRLKHALTEGPTWFEPAGPPEE